MSGLEVPFSTDDGEFLVANSDGTTDDGDTDADDPEEANFDISVTDGSGSTDSDGLGTLEVAGDFVGTVDADVPKKSGTDIASEAELEREFEFDSSVGSSSAKQQFVVVSLRMSDENGNEVVQTYFVSDTRPSTSGGGGGGGSN